MCGIAGFLGPPRSDESLVAATLAAALAHRGPDGEGIESFDVLSNRRLTMVHRRLAILDLSPLGRQPMHDPRTGNLVTYNGEIYNFKTIREGLLADGEVFRSSTDTEVLLRTYARDGLDMLGIIQG